MIGVSKRFFFGGGNFANNMIDQHTDFLGVSLDWFKGNMTGTPYI